MTAPTKRGGARPNAGRATDGATGLRRVETKLTPAQHAKAAAIGQGNASAGIRAALDALPEISTTKGK